MLLTVKALQGRECSLQVSPEERVGALKALVAERLQVPVEQQRLLFRGKALADERRLSDYSIGPSARLNLVLKPPAGGGGARGGGGAGTPPEDLGEPPPPPPAFGPGLAQILGRHFGSQEGPRVLQQLLKDYERALRGLSLDDLERLGARLLQEGGEGEPPPSPSPTPGPSPTSAAPPPPPDGVPKTPRGPPGSAPNSPRIHPKFTPNSPRIHPQIPAGVE